jgi:signal transduction histidine kinase
VSSELMTVGQASEVFSILRDVTDEPAANAELRAAYEAASGRASAFAAERRAERIRRTEAEASVASFVALASFELKAPLRNLRGFVGVLQDNLDAGHFEQARSNARQIDLAAQRMELRVGALAQLAELDRVMPSRHDIDMAAMARSMSNAVLASRAAAKVDLAIAALPHARADPHLVAQLWKHLLDNAIKFSMGTNGARVKVEACEEAGRCWYRVSDNGAGFDAQRASQLFQPFQRMHAAREFEGLGIGLCLAQRIVRRHEGEIRLRSQAGLGTVVEFTLDPLPA